MDVGEEGETVDILGEMYGTDENLPPLEKLERYFQSETVMDRYVYLCVWGGLVGGWVGGVCAHVQGIYSDNGVWVSRCCVFLCEQLH